MNKDIFHLQKKNIINTMNKKWNFEFPSKRFNKITTTVMVIIRPDTPITLSIQRF